jgi:hypothetical protein
METDERKVFTAMTAAQNVVSFLASYLEGPDEFPHGLVLTIGGSLIEHLDAYGDNADPDIKRLYDACGERMTRMSNEETVDSSG